MAPALLAFVALWGTSNANAAPPCRDRWHEPFSSDSIWNTAIGSGAKFHPALLFADGDYRGQPANFHNDQDFLVRVTADDPLTDWINQGDWGADPGGHCAIQPIAARLERRR